jgi:hypothetical protein
MNPETITFQDELQPDKSVRRTYSNGVLEWRRKLADGRISWEDSNNQSGVDELLDSKTVKRTYTDGRIVYGREQGYGRTAWSGGSNSVTVNQSSFGGQVGMILAGLGAGALLGSVVWPPDVMSAEEEEYLRQQAQSAGSSSSTSGNSGDSGDWGGSDGGDWGSDSDFG